MNHYRDPLAGLRSQVATKRAQLEERERALSPVLRALLPSRLREAAHDLQPRARASGDSMEALSDTESALDASLALHDEVVALAPSLRECEPEVPDPPAPHMPPPWLFEEPYLVGVREAVSARLLQIHSDARVTRWGDFGYLSRFRIDDAPFAFVVTSEVMTDAELVARHTSSLRTTVPESLGRLTVSLERTHHAIGKALHLVHDLEIGEPTFDDRFWIAGSPDVTAVLTPDVRAALGRLADQSPVLHVGGGLATLTWTAHWKRVLADALPDAALDALVGIRTAVAYG